MLLVLVVLNWALGIGTVVPVLILPLASSSAVLQKHGTTVRASVSRRGVGGAAHRPNYGCNTPWICAAVCTVQ
jgi:hypothetical protein